VEQRHDGQTGFEAARTGNFDVIVLDVMLRSATASASAWTSQRWRADALLMLTAKDGELDESKGSRWRGRLLAQAFERSVLIARIHALLRARTGRAQHLVVGPVSLDPCMRRRVQRRQRDAHPRDSRCSEYLMSNARTAREGDILNAVWAALRCDRTSWRSTWLPATKD